jgi:sigma-B regulation protein RsbQ
MPSAASLHARITDHCRRHNVTITGTDGPLLILQHGFGTDLTVWHKVLPALEPHFCIIRMNLAGSGESGAEMFDPGRYAHIESHADDLLRTLGDLGVEDCLFVGASVGSMVGMLSAIERPRLFRKMIVIGASPRYLNDGDYVGGFEQEHLNGLYDSMSRDYSGWIAGFAPLAVRGLPESEAVREFAESLFQLRPDIALLTARTIFQSDFRNQLPLIEPPVVLLQTENDIAVPPQVGEYLQAHIPNATLEVLPVEGHFPHMAAPAVVSEALLRYLL